MERSTITSSHSLKSICFHLPRVSNILPVHDWHTGELTAPELATRICTPCFSQRNRFLNAQVKLVASQSGPTHAEALLKAARYRRDKHTMWNL